MFLTSGEKTAFAAKLRETSFACNTYVRRVSSGRKAFHIHSYKRTYIQIFRSFSREVRGNPPVSHDTYHTVYFLRTPTKGCYDVVTLCYVCPCVRMKRAMHVVVGTAWCNINDCVRYTSVHTKEQFPSAMIRTARAASRISRINARLGYCIEDVIDNNARLDYHRGRHRQLQWFCLVRNIL